MTAVGIANAISQIRDKIDERLLQIKNYLESTGVGYRGSLVDKEGFPLPDIDHYKILEERQRALRLLNDRKKLDFLLEKLAFTNDVGSSEKLLLTQLISLRPFAIIDDIGVKSPAESSGLMEGDFLIRFGDAADLSQIPQQIVEGTSVPVSVFRCDQLGQSRVDLALTPAKWNGNGLVGCHLVPLNL